jgi:Tol biopolymer transport system component
MGPVSNIVENLYLADVAHPEQVRQLTNADQGIDGFDVAPDGNSIVYSQLEAQGAASLYTFDVASGASRLLYRCKDAACRFPVFRPDGGALAFERVDLNSGTGMAAGVQRVWVLDLSANTAVPLFKDNQQLGYLPRWTPDGTRLAVFNLQAGAGLSSTISNQEMIRPFRRSRERSDIFRRMAAGCTFRKSWTWAITVT